MITTASLRLFIKGVDDNWPWLYNTLAVTEVSFYCSLSRWICPYCGVENEKGTFCVGCQSPKPSTKNGGQVIVAGTLPEATVFNGLKNAFELFVVVCTKCERADRFDHDRVLLHVSECKVVQKIIPELMTTDWESSSLVFLYATISGKIELRNVQCD